MDKYPQLAEYAKTLFTFIQKREVTDLLQKARITQTLKNKLEDAYESDGNTKEVNDAIITSGLTAAADAFIETSKWFHEATRKKSLPKEENDAMSLYLMLTSSVITSLTDKYTQFCEYCANNQVIRAIIELLQMNLNLIEHQYEQYRNDKIKTEQASYLLLILQNILRRCPTATQQITADDRGVIKTYLQGDHYESMTMALFALSFVVQPDEKINITQEHAVELTCWLKAALQDAWDDYRFNFTAVEVLESLCNVANCSDNCVTQLVKAGILDYVDAILTAPTPIDEGKHDRYEHTKPEDATKLVDATTEKEKQLALQLCWMAKFADDALQVLRSRPSTISALQQVATSKDTSESLTLKATNLKLTLELSATDKSRQAQQEQSGRLLSKRHQTTPSKLASGAAAAAASAAAQTQAQVAGPAGAGNRIFVSYSHQQTELVFRVVEALRANGLNDIHIDSEMVGNWYVWMIDEIEKADIVLLCYSQAYYESAYCKDEALNAISLRKRIIPLQCENYSAISWLGGVTRPRMWRAFWDPSKFDESVKALTAEIKNESSGLTAGGAVTADVRLDLGGSIDEADGVKKQTPRRPETSSKSSTHRAATGKQLLATTAAPIGQVSSSSDKSIINELESIESDVMNWNVKKTNDWLAAAGYPVSDVDRKTIGGEFICALMHLERTTPKTLYKLLSEGKGLKTDQVVAVMGKIRSLRHKK